MAENFFNRLNHWNEKLNDCSAVTALGIIILVTHFIDNNVIILATVLPALFPVITLLAIVELLDKASNKALSREAAIAVDLGTGAEGNIVQLLKILSLNEQLEERLLLHDVLQDEGSVYDSLILFGTLQLINELSHDHRFLFGYFAGDILFKVRIYDMQDSVDHLSNTAWVYMSKKTRNNLVFVRHYVGDNLLLFPVD